MNVADSLALGQIQQPQKSCGRWHLESSCWNPGSFHGAFPFRSVPIRLKDFQNNQQGLTVNISQLIRELFRAVRGSIPEIATLQQDPDEEEEDEDEGEDEDHEEEEEERSGPQPAGANPTKNGWFDFFLDWITRKF